MVELFAPYPQFFFFFYFSPPTNHEYDDGRWNVKIQQEIKERKEKKKCWKKEINILRKLLPSWICGIWKLSSAWKRSSSRHLFYCREHILLRLWRSSRIQLNLRKLQPGILVRNDFFKREKKKKEGNLKSNSITFGKVYFLWHHFTFEMRDIGGLFISNT